MDSVPAEIVPLANLAVSQELMPVLRRCTGFCLLKYNKSATVLELAALDLFWLCNKTKYDKRERERGFSRYVLVVVIVQDAAISPICTFNRDFIIRRPAICPSRCIFSNANCCSILPGETESLNQSRFFWFVADIRGVSWMDSHKDRMSCNALVLGLGFNHLVLHELHWITAFHAAACRNHGF